MIQEEFGSRLSILFKGLSYNWKKISENHFEFSRNVFSHLLVKLLDVKNYRIRPKDIRLDNYQYVSHRVDDLPLTLAKDSGPGVKYGYTENSEFAREAEKTNPQNIDSFETKEALDPDEATEGQDYRIRKQNADLDQRYFTSGLEINQNDLQKNPRTG